MRSLKESCSVNGVHVFAQSRIGNGGLYKERKFGTFKCLLEIGIKVGRNLLIASKIINYSLQYLNLFKNLQVIIGR